MPYFITDKSSQCSGWAVTKQNGDVIGCHKTKQSAIKQMVAVSLAEKMKPGGERALNDELEVGDFVFWENAGQTEYGLITFISTYGVVTDQLGATVIATQDRPIAKISVYELVGDRLVGTDRFVIKSFAPLTKLEMPDYEEDHNNDDEDNLVDDLDDDMRIDVKVPAYMRAAARRGLQYVSEGKAGDGLKQQTINEARKMAAGEISDDKWIRMAAWIARHLGDLDSPEADPQHPNYPSAGVVAHLLWGSGPSKTKARAAMEFAQGVVERIRKEEERHLAGKHDQSSHGKGGVVLDDMPFELNPNGQNASSIIGVSQSKVNEFYETATDAEKQLFEDNLRRSFTIAAEDEMVIQYPSDRLKNLAKDERLKTIHEGVEPKYTSKEYIKNRKEQELTSYGVPSTAKKEEFPIYGHLPGKNFSQYKPVAMYGNTQLVLKEKLAGRATMTLGDSLGFAIPVKITSVRNGTATTADLINAATPKVLDIHISQARRGNVLNSVVDAGYTEIQIYGGVKLSDLSSIRISPSAWNNINNTNIKTAEKLRETGLIELKSDWIR